MADHSSYYLSDRAELRKIVGEVGPRVANKTIDHIDKICADFIAVSPYVLWQRVAKMGCWTFLPRDTPLVLWTC